MDDMLPIGSGHEMGQQDINLRTRRKHEEGSSKGLSPGGEMPKKMCQQKQPEHKEAGWCIEMG